MPSNLVNPNPPIQLQTIFLAAYLYVPGLYGLFSSSSSMSVLPVKWDFSTNLL